MPRTEGASQQVRVEGQATGEVAGDDPDQLVTAVIACLDGLSRVAPRHAGQGREYFPDSGIIMRLLRVPGGLGKPDTTP